MTDKENWFTIDQVDDTTYALSEYRHWEQTHCYLLVGKERALLIDTGLGIGNIADVVHSLSDKSVAAVATHIHWDHIGGHRYFPDFYAHKGELEWLNGRFPLPTQVVRDMVSDCSSLPDGMDISAYEIFQGAPTRILSDGDVIDLGERTVHVLHTPGHSPGHMCFWESERGYLFTGDLVYQGMLYADYPSTDPEQYLESLERIAELYAKRLFPGHHGLTVQPDLVTRMRDEFRNLKAEGLLRHGGGTFNFGDWAVRL